ncbi:MAG: MMPL family transporter [Dehalococcoidia bacterium]
MVIEGDIADPKTQQAIDDLKTELATDPALVLSLRFVLLTIVFRSIVVPIKAIIMNLLSVGAAYGILVLVFQKGFLNEIFGLQETSVIQPWLPLMLFTILFGLSMDYQVFLISRIREKYDETDQNAAAVAFGIRSTAGIITGAALIMVAVFGGFAAGDLVTTSQFGFGLAVAILIDATIVRSVLVPATMKLLGDKNWYLPSFLHWLPDLRVEGGAPIVVPDAAAAPAGGDD